MNHHIIYAFIAVVATAGTTGCSGLDTQSDDCAADTLDFTSASPGECRETPEEYSDLRLFELKGPVKECVKETFYDVTLDSEEKISVDSAADKRHTSSLYFDKLGNYVAGEYERVDRDDKGRIIYWRDRRPNARGVDPGMLRDTLRYTHLNSNVLQSKGMGEYAVTVYDNDNRIVGQYSEPDVDGTQMSAFNIYRRFDDRGNWTERLTVWTTRSAGSRPHVSYTLDNRKVTYY